MSLLVIFSKGNLARVADDGLRYHQSLNGAVWHALQTVGYYSTLWLLSPLFVSAFVVLFIYNPLPVGAFVGLVKKHRIIVLCGFLLSGLAVYMPLYLFEALLPFPRITTLFFFVFFHACFIAVPFYRPDILRLTKTIRNRVQKRYIKFAVTAVLAISAFTNRNFIWVSKDLLEGVSAKYDAESYQRYEKIRTCKSDTCFVSPHRNWPYFARSSDDETSDAAYFRHMNVFYKKTILFR